MARAAYRRLVHALEAARDASQLADAPTAHAEIEDLLLRLRDA